MPPLLFAAICASMVIVPFIFESYTFYLYTIGEPGFFVFSGARLWVFLASELSLGFALGWLSKFPLYVTAGIIAATMLVLMSMLYQFCDPRQCYYSGPDGLSWIRLGTLLFATATTGLMLGSKSKTREPTRKSSINALLFGATMPAFIGYYGVALIFGTFLAYPLSLVILAFSSTVPFLFAGIASSLFSDRTRYAIYSAILSWAVLSALFAVLRPESAILAAVIIAGGIPVAVLGQRITRRIRESAVNAVLLSTIALFGLTSSHAFLDAPMSLAINDSGTIVKPTYYTGAYHNEQYFPTKRVEVKLDLERFDGSMIKEGDFVLAGIGAQSPNCCKDGLDYGYRTDVLFTEEGRYLVARAWETCDQNMGCSALPWMSAMHEAIVPLRSNLSSVMLAMEWADDGSTVNWYYKTNGNWSRYSSFTSPEIENPYFNLGVLDVGSPLFNPDSGKAYFYQAGVSTPNQDLRFGEITLDCLSYYDRQGEKICPPLIEVKGGNSHWKVLWKWGLPDGNARVEVQGTTVTIS